MRVKVSDYIAEYFVQHGIDTVFTVVGGGAMHLNHSFGSHKGIRCLYNHHEQASSMAAESYYRVNNQMAGLCVTSGPGAINALNGVIGAYQDSIPMIVVSGQVKSTLTVKSSGLKLRTLGGQEFDIVSALANACKYSETVTEASRIKECLDKAFSVALSGRPGPCWLDIPVDIQGAYIGSDDFIDGELPKSTRDIDDKVISRLVDKIDSAIRPVIYAGNGIRISGGVDIFHKLVYGLKIPVVTCWDSIDLIETDNEYYVGRAGTMGDRAGNFAVQNSDLLICIGSRLSIYQVGYNVNTWAREAYVVDVDIDSEELKKPTIRVDMPICADAREFMEDLLTKNITVTDEVKRWVDICNNWKNKYPVVSESQKKQAKLVNVYGFIDYFSRKIGDNSITVVGNGSASVVGSAAYYIGRNCRFIMNCALSSMGYDLPAAIGAAVADSNNCRDIYCITGDGSIMMNLQELQTIVTNTLPIKIVILNNQGYHQIRLTQSNLFDKEFHGMGPESNDLSFPNFSKVAAAFGYPYYSVDSMADISKEVDAFLSMDGRAILEVFCDTSQVFEPKSATKRLEDGSLYSPPLEDLAPFLSRDELKSNMYIPTV